MPDTFAIIDDNQLIAQSIAEILGSVGLQCRVFSNANDFLSANLHNKICALITDIRMPFKSGLQLMDEIKSQNWSLPVVFITAYADVKVIVQAMKSGAVDVLEKPFREQELIDAANECMRISLKLKEQRSKERGVCKRADRLSDREFEVLKLLIEGKLSKLIADDLNLSPRTVERHRSNVMKKMEVSSLPELVYCAQSLSKAGWNLAP